MEKILKALKKALDDLAKLAVAGFVEGTVQGAVLGHNAPPQVIIMGANGAQPPPGGTPPTAPPTPAATPLNVAAAGALAAATGAATNMGNQLVQGAGQLAAQVGPTAQRIGHGIAEAVDDAWVPPAVALFGVYIMYALGLLLLLPDATLRIRWLSHYYPAATHGWYTLAFLGHIVAIVGVVAMAIVACTKPTRGDRLNFRVTGIAVGMMLLIIPLAPLALASALASAIHSGRLAGVRVHYLSELYIAGNTLIIIGVVVALLYGFIVNALIGGVDAAADAARGENVRFEAGQEWLSKWGVLALTLIVVRFAILTYFPYPQLAADFLNYGLPLVVVGMLLFKATGIEVMEETWQKVSITFLLIVIGTTIWVWFKTRHFAEFEQAERFVSAQGGLVGGIWDSYLIQLHDNTRLVLQHHWTGVGAGIVQLLLVGFFGLLLFGWIAGVAWGQASGAHWRKLVFGLLFLISAIIVLGSFVDCMSIVFGWVNAVRLH